VQLWRLGLARDQFDQEQSRCGQDQAGGLGCWWDGHSDAAWRWKAQWWAEFVTLWHDGLVMIGIYDLVLY